VCLELRAIPGTDKKGLDHTFEDGVTVIVGVNGLGKTTLLNMILRSLLGDNEPAKFDPFNPGAGVHKMVKQHSEYFAERTTNFASGATVDAGVCLRQNQGRVLRQLRTLDIEQALVEWRGGKGRAARTPHEIVKASGLTNLYDFFYVVAVIYLLPRGQGRPHLEPARSVRDFPNPVFDAERAKQFAELGDNIQSLDSQFAISRFNVNKQTKELRQSEDNSTDDGQLREQLRLKEVDLNILDEKEADARQQIDEH